MKQAKERSGAKTKPTESKTDPKKPEKLTGTQKAEAAKRSKDYYEKNKEPVEPAKEEADLEAKIAKVREKIAKAQADIKASIQKARDQTT